jgi:hypothetical protein
MSVADYDLKNTLETWDVEAEQRKADFIQALYDFYRPRNGLYTGLFERFQRDLTDHARIMVTEGFCDISEIFFYELNYEK